MQSNPLQDTTWNDVDQFNDLFEPLPISCTVMIESRFANGYRLINIVYIRDRKDTGILMENELLGKLADKSTTTKELFITVEQNFDLLPQLLEGVSSSKASIRYGCAKVLLDLSEAYPEKLYRHMDFFISLLDNKYRILAWNAIAITANLTKVDKYKRFDAAFSKYYSLMNDEYMVTVANVVGNSGKIALAKPYLIDKITNELLRVDDIPVTPHLTEECKRVIAEKAIESFDLFFDKVKQKKRVISLVEKHSHSPRKTLKATAENFLRKWG